MKCNSCGGIIPEGRLKALPQTRVCTPCSSEGAYVANQIVHNDEDYSELEFIKDPNTIAELQRLKALQNVKIPPARG